MGKELSEKDALKIFHSKVWKEWTHEEIVRFQLFEERLCVPFHLYHKAIEKVLDRNVWTHEFVYLKRLQEEYLGKRKKPTIQDNINLLPKDNQIILNLFKGLEN